MKKAAFIFLAFLVISCTEPQRYVHKAISIMDKNGLFAEGAQWDSTKNAALKAKPETMVDAYAIVREALKVAGGKHSFLSPASRVTEDKLREWEMPSVSILDNNVASIKLPPFHGNKEDGMNYANTVIDGIPDDISGIILDLRGNVGGDMYPMIAAVHRFIPDGNDMLRFKMRKRTSFIPRSYVLSCAGVSEKPNIDCPVAILTDSLTASSGEATLLCFRGLENVKTFGCPTAGYASSNCPYAMTDGSALVLTTGCDLARTNEEFCDEPIAPDVFTLKPERDALNWLVNYAEGTDFSTVFSLLDLERPGLEKVKESYASGRWKKASRELLEYYRTRPEVKLPGLDPGNVRASAKDSVWASDALEHTFHVLAQPVWNYGKDINWEYWPVKDIEIRVQLHRQPWWGSLANMYRSSGDERYAEEYVYEFRDWVKKNPYKAFPIDQRGTVSSGKIDTDAPNECFAWRPLEVGIRLGRWCNHFALFSTSKNFTPEFLLEFLHSYHENASNMMKNFSPAGNHVIHQSQGIIQGGIYFPEFKDANAWLQAGVENLNREISRQTYPDGCHIEFDPGYHIGFVSSYNTAIRVASLNGKMELFPDSCLDKLAKVARYYLDYTYPDWTHPCFSDARRNEGRRQSMLMNVYDYRKNDPTLLWFATDGKEGEAPEYKSSGHPETGFYTFRDGWFDGKIVMPVKATERGTWHAQPDFGTFELMAFGKVLMPDAGAFTYSGDEEIERQRAFFKATARHNALTLDDKNYDDPSPKLLTWRPDGPVQLLSVQHQAYKGLTRRRSIAFVEEKFFVVMDEVSGPATGKLTLRNCLGSKGALSQDGNGYTYLDGKAGLRILALGPEGSSLEIRKDWVSERYGEKEERPVVCVDAIRKKGSGTQRFLTVLCPFEGVAAPQVSVSMSEKDGSLMCSVSIDGKEYRIGL